MDSAEAYRRFIDAKLQHDEPTGLPDVPALHPGLFDFQRDLVAWALRRGRAAIFADTGLGKSRQECEWARHVLGYTGAPVLILAPLAVAPQTVGQGAAIGVPVRHVRDGSEVDDPGVYITNYDRLHRFNPRVFAGIVLDESSCIKHESSKTLAALIEAFSQTPFRLCATATPSPNDYTELGTHAEFLGICRRTEMLAEFFCHDGGETQTWRLKGHARTAFWRWVASWGAMVRRPSDIGYSDEAYALPPLRVEHHVLPADPATVKAAGLLFAAPAGNLTERRAARKASLTSRVIECASLVNSDRQPWCVWCDLNDESAALTKAIDGAVEVRGSQDSDEKESRLQDFAEGRARVIVSKPSICGFGLNWQHCARMAFVGVNDSYEAYYQAVRRVWRFGQTKPVVVHVFASEVEGSVVENLRRKEKAAAEMAEELSTETRAAVLESVRGQTRTVNTYAPGIIKMPGWLRSEVA